METLISLAGLNKVSRFSELFSRKMRAKQRDIIEGMKDDVVSEFANDDEEEVDEEEVDEGKGIKTRAADGSSKSDRAKRSRNKKRGLTAAGNVKKQANKVKAKAIRRANKAAFDKGKKKSKISNKRFK